MTYQRTLPVVFPYAIRATPAKIRTLAYLLLQDNRSDVRNGSSFAITVEHRDQWNLWLSNSSYRFLLNEDKDLETRRIQHYRNDE